MIIKAINKILNNVKVKHRFRRRSSVDEFDTRKVQQKMESSHIAYDNMLVAGMRLQRVEDDMEQHLNDQMNKISTCTEVERMQRKGGKV